MWKLERTDISWGVKGRFPYRGFENRGILKSWGLCWPEDGRGIQKDFKKEFWWFCTFQMFNKCKWKVLYSFQVLQFSCMVFKQVNVKGPGTRLEDLSLIRSPKDTSLRLRCQNLYLKMRVQQKAEVSGKMISILKAYRKSL